MEKKDLACKLTPSQEKKLEKLRASYGTNFRLIGTNAMDQVIVECETQYDIFVRLIGKKGAVKTHDIMHKNEKNHPEDGECWPFESKKNVQT